jgi:S-adenosylmethionine:tRNA ribosyltransferase-isomerase
MMMVSFCVLQTSTAHPGRRGDHRQFLTTHGTLPFKPGDVFRLTPGLEFTLLEKGDFGKGKGSLRWYGDLLHEMECCGEPPLPPYIKRKPGTADVSRYQTVYADAGAAGSVAAPTAGLHFDAAHVRALRDAGFGWCETTLYVGYGTFSPIRCEDVREHRMHPEYVRLEASSAAMIQDAKENGRPIVAVGTTVVRTLEGIYRELGALEAFDGWLNLYIYPGFAFKVVDHMITNFHLPRSSLLVLVSAFAGRDRVLGSYNSCLSRGYRFFSYGDATLVL